MQQVQLRRDDRCGEPAIRPLPRFARVAVLAEHLEIAQFEREIGIQHPRLDVVDLQSHTIVPFRFSVEHALRSATVCECIRAQGLVADFVPFTRPIKNAVIENFGAA